VAGHDISTPTGTQHELLFEKLSPRNFEGLCLELPQHNGFADIRASGRSLGQARLRHDCPARRRVVSLPSRASTQLWPSRTLAEIEKVFALISTRSRKWT
jgi:hypothetical protein